MIFKKFQKRLADDTLGYIALEYWRKFFAILNFTENDINQLVSKYENSEIWN